MSALTVTLHSITLLTSILHVPLNNLLKSEYITDVTLAYYSTDTTGIAQAASSIIKCAHQKWRIINMNLEFELDAYYTKAHLFEYSAQDKHFIILSLEVSQNITSETKLCFDFVLCSYLVLVETNNFPMNHTYLHDLIVKLRAGNFIHYVALLLYSAVDVEVKICFISNNGELIVLDHFDTVDNAYDRVFKEQYELFRTSETINMFAMEFTSEIYMTKPYNAVNIEEKFVTGGYVYLAIMIGRYFDAKVRFYMQNVSIAQDPEYEEWTIGYVESKHKTTADEILPLSHILNIYDS